MSELRDVRGVAVADRGTDDSRPPLVLLHGLTFDHTMWGPALAELAAIDPDRRVVSLQLPGHGESQPLPSYELDTVADVLHDVTVELGLGPPVMVGHSLSGVLATVYASRYDVAGIVNVDQPLDIGPFVQILHSIADQLRGPAFADMWNVFASSWHVENLPPVAEELVRNSSTPRQDLVLGYWRDVMEGDAGELEQRMADALAELRRRTVTYVMVVGSAPAAAALDWLQTVLPQLELDVFEGSGHFPHLAHPGRFATVLHRTGAWGSTG